MTGSHAKSFLGDPGHGSGKRTNVGIRLPPSGSMMGVGDNGSNLLEPEIGFMPFREKPETNALSYEWVSIVAVAGCWLLASRNTVIGKFDSRVKIHSQVEGYGFFSKLEETQNGMV